MHTYKEFCQHYEYEESDDDSRVLYYEYKSQLQMFSEIEAEAAKEAEKLYQDCYSDINLD